MKKGSGSKGGIILLLLLLVLAVIPAAVSAEGHERLLSSSEAQKTLTPAKDGTHLAETIDKLGGADGLYGQGLNGFDMYDHLGYVYLGWRTTGGIWQNRVIGDYIMGNLKEAGYKTTDADVEAPYGTKPASDKSSAADDDYAWEIQYQETEDEKLGDTWDPEYASLDVKIVDSEGKPVNDAEADAFTKKVSGEYWAYNPETEVYQKNFADLFGLDYDTELAPLQTSERILKMRDVLMVSDVDPDKRMTVDDYTFIRRDSIGEPNKEAVLNRRTKLAWNSCFTDPAGTEPAKAAGLDGEIVYVGEIKWSGENSEGIPNEELAGKIILTDSSMYMGYDYAVTVGAVGVASKSAMQAFLCPKDESGNILDPWYDSSRFAAGCLLDDAEEQMAKGKPVVAWQFSNRQYDSLKALLIKAKEINESAQSDADKVKVTGRQIAVGQIYSMTKTEGSPGVGQAVAIAEVKGSVHPEKRVIICAHVQEPGCGDNATGVASLLSMAATYKKLVDAGKIDRPKCTITFMWGDELNLASFWMDGHPEEKADLIGALDMDMTGQDPDKTGGVMRIEKTPDPSAKYGYTRDAVPWDEPNKSISSKGNPYYDDAYSNNDGNFVRLPDSDTLWGSEGVDEGFNEGWYLNDLYMYVTSTVIDRHDKDFRVDVCPYEGGSDHSIFLQSHVPALLTWHFTDYNYHTSTDTLYMASPREMESVGLTTLACALMMSDSCTDADTAADILGAVKEAGLKRMDAEAENTDHHLIYVKAGHTTMSDALSNEKEVLSAWGKWYDEALGSVATLFDGTSETLDKAIDSARSEMSTRTSESLLYAETVLSGIRPKSTKITGLKSVRRGFTVKWKKKSQVSGYQVRWSLRPDMSRAGKKFIKSGKKTKYTKAGLKKNRKYYVQVRTYKTVKGRKYYSAWSRKKTVKTR